MNKKITALVLGALTLGALSVRAQTPAPAPAPAAPAAPSASWVLTPSFASQYMFRGARLGGPSFEPSLEFDYGSLALGVWMNTPISDKVVGQSDPEIDPYGSYTFEVVKNVTLQPGFTLYTYPNADKTNGFYKTTFEPSLALNWTPIDGWKLTPKIYYDIVLSQTTYEFNVAYTAPLKDLGTELDFAATLGTFSATDALENSPPTKNWGDYWLAGVSLPFQVTKDQKLTIGVAYTKGSDNYLKIGTTPKFINSAAVGRGVVTVSYAISF